MSKEIELITTDLSEKLKSFDELLESIEGLPDETRTLWKQIYQNATQDRDDCAALFRDLRDLVLRERDEAESPTAKGASHAMHGPTLAKYLERLGRATDQLIKLAELVASAQRKAEEIDTDSLFQQLGS